MAVQEAAGEVRVARSVTCRLCGGTGGARFLGLDELVRCAACGLVWRTPLDAGSTADLYEGDFFAGSYYSAYFARASQWRHEAALRLRWLRQFGQPRRLLEVGSGGGFFVEQAALTGIVATGIEPAADGGRYAREELGVDVLTGLFETTAVTGPFDAVCAFHVLEHTEDPDAFLAKARSLLRANGLLALEVPNIAARRARRDGAGWFNLAADHHLWHFSPSTLSRFVSRAGFEVVAVDTVFPRHYFRVRRVVSRSGLANALCDWRCNPAPRRSHPTRGDHLRLVARRPLAATGG